MNRIALAAVAPTFLWIATNPAHGTDREALHFFESEVRPLLSAECYDCHGPDKAKGGLRLDHIDKILKGGNSGPAIVPESPGESLLIEAIRREDEDFAMPPKKSLPSASVAVLEKWVELGAPWPDEQPRRAAVDERGFSEDDYAWWAVQPVKDPVPPDSGEDWARNTVDRFVHARLEEAGLSPAPEASREELIRRVTYDLHGLPPTPEEVETFLADTESGAWERLVDRLLESPRYGERWAQHWLDVVRYAESDGYRADDFRPGVWRYRDYVIDSFNADKPYDQFVREQLAADEFAGSDPDSLIATAFLRLGIYEWNQRNARMHWDLIMTEMTNVTAEAFLGVGIGCAQCHDHKFDPILQKDHFALRSFLNNVWWPESHPLATPEEVSAYEEKEAAWKEATAPIRAELDEMKKAKIESASSYTARMFPEDIQKVYAKPAEERNAHEEQLAQLVQRQVDHRIRRFDWDKELGKGDDEKAKRYRELKKQLAEFDHLKPTPLPSGFVATDVKPEPVDAWIMKRGEKVPVEPAFLTLLGDEPPAIDPAGETTGRRTALADWIARDDNPLSTRVIVNRIWQHHFGAGIVPTPNDFGTLGEEPSHPDLLDWLTTRFLENDWKFKSLHRVILNSAAYRQTARVEPSNRAAIVDPTNRLLWRYPPRRLEAEQARDGMLSISGELRERSGGDSVDGKEPVRSIYVRKKRNTPDELIGAFDAPAGFSSTANRVSTTTPTQSLQLVNGEWTMKRAEAFAKRLLADAKEPDSETVRRAFQLAYAREATGEEIAASLSFVESQRETTGAPAMPEPKFPGETGLRPASQYFSKAGGIETGDHALWLQPGSRFERLDFSGVELPTEDFTLEAIAHLDSIHRDASVNTLVGRWDGSHKSIGWAFGVTSEKSRYDPRNVILQLVGDDFQGNRVYEVVASNLRFPLAKPVYLAVSLSARPSGEEATYGSATFYLRDLSDPEAKLEQSTVSHQIVGGLDANRVRSLLGGRDQKGHLWDGQLARLVIHQGALGEDQLLLGDRPAPDPVVDWTFSGPDGAEPAPNTRWIREASPRSSDPYAPGVLAAMTDFCHALLTSNEFLYLH